MLYLAILYLIHRTVFAIHDAPTSGDLEQF